MKLPYKEQFKKIVIPEMKKEFKIENDLGVPKITKVIVNVGIGRLMTASKDNKELIKRISEVTEIITGQKSSPRPAR